MSRLPLIVFADDLTGAAEVAAIAHERGLRAVVATRRPSTEVDADVLVFDTDTRLAKPAAAARRVRALAKQLEEKSRAGFFKKIDSALRGPVLAELRACLDVLGYRRALLIAGNPSLGRVIRNRQYFIDGRPLDQTTFATDPHHPARTADVLSLLGPAKDMRVVHRLPAAPLPRTGMIVGEHRSPTDTQAWARRVDRQTLPVGGADFFRAWLDAYARASQSLRPVEAIAEPALLLHGTTANEVSARALRFNGLRAPSAVRVASALRQRGGGAVAATSLTRADPLAPPIIALNFGQLARDLRHRGAFRHLLIAGGATAASVLRALGWTRLEVVRVWSPGVVSLRPITAPEFTVTLKPGSYAWPANLRRTLPAVFS